MGCVNSTQRTEPLKLMVLGIDNAGKSTFIAAIKGEDIDLVAPTVGFSPEDFKLGQRPVKVYDLGGGAGFRGIWNNYYAEVHGIVYVVDSADTSRFETVKENLAKEFAHPRLHSKPVLLLANKKDLPGAKSKDELRKQLALDQLPLTIHIQPCSSYRKRGKRLDSGIKSGIKWLIKEVDAHFEAIGEKVTRDVEEYNADMKREREEKRRLRAEKLKRDEEEAALKEAQQREAAPAADAATLASGPASATDGIASPRNTAALSGTSGNSSVDAATPVIVVGEVPGAAGSSQVMAPTSVAVPVHTGNNNGGSGEPLLTDSDFANTASSKGSVDGSKGGGSLNNGDHSGGGGGGDSARSDGGSNNGASLVAKPSLPRIGSSPSGPVNLDAILSDSPFPSTKLSPKLLPLNTLNTPLEVR